jgi:O-antigen/teichoic acid export membrane protein
LGIVLTDILTSLPFARLRFENRARHFSILKIINVLLNIGFNVFFLYLLPKIQHIEFFQSIYSPSFTYGYAFLSNLLANGITLLILLPTYQFSFRNIDFKIIGVMLLYSYPIVLSGLAGMINDVGDKIFLDFFIEDNFEGNYAIGVYGANYKIATLMIIFIQMIKYAAEPFFFRISDQSDHKQIYAQVTKTFVYTGLLIFIGIIGYIDLFKYFIDVEYRVGLNIVPFVLLGNFFFGVFYNVSIWYKITDKTRFGMYFTFVGATITILLNALLVPKYGYMGAAIATLACFVSMALINIIVGHKQYLILLFFIDRSLFKMLRKQT